MSFSVKALLEQHASWINAEGAMSDLILSSRIRLARNIKGIRFVSQAGEDELRTILPRLGMALDELTGLEGGQLVLMEDLSLIERQFLFERHLISHDMTVGAPQQAVFIEPNEIFGIMINEEDHLRLQTLASGFQLQESFERLNRLDDRLAERVEYAFSSELGYQTSCPTNVGTGLRASVLVHLPSLVLTKKIRKVLAGVHQVGLSVRGFWGEGSDVVGNFFQISNQVTLGERETQTLKNLDRVIRQVLDYEEKARDILIREARMEVEDKVGRAHGTLCHARVLTSQEMIGLLSAVRFGITLGMADMPDLRVLNELLILGQPAHMQLRIGREMSSIERNRFRADLVRERITKAMNEMSDPGGRGQAPNKGEES